MLPAMNNVAFNQSPRHLQPIISPRDTNNISSPQQKNSVTLLFIYKNNEMISNSQFSVRRWEKE